jgi:hypothetical protein
MAYIEFKFTDDQVKEIQKKNRKYLIVFDGDNRIVSINKVHVGMTFVSNSDGMTKTVEGFTFDPRLNVFTVYYKANSHKHLFSRLSLVLQELKKATLL